MKKGFGLIFVFTVFLVGCHDLTPKKDLIIHEFLNESGQEKDDIYDFYFINKAPQASKKHPLDELIKIYFSDGQNKAIAIDIGNNEVYIDPRWSGMGVDTLEETVELNQEDVLLDILEKHRVQEWKYDYTTEDPDSYQDGYGWLLVLQFADGTVEKHRGAGTDFDKITPESFDGFTQELQGFMKKELAENDMSDFALIGEAPDAIGIHELNEVIKVFLSQNDGSLDKGFAVDLKRKEIYIDPWMSPQGIVAVNAPVNVNDSGGIIDILKKYKIQKWETDYAADDAEDDSFCLVSMMQF
jgi:hypothetical protein